MLFKHVEEATTVVKDAPVHIAAAFGLGPVKVPKVKGGLGTELREELPDGSIILKDGASLEWKQGEVCECRLLTQIDSRGFELDLSQYPALAEDETVYLVANLRCELEQETVFRAFNIFGRIWLDGRLVFHNYFSASFRLLLTEGDHTIVIALNNPTNDRSLRISGAGAEQGSSAALAQELVERNLRHKLHLIGGKRQEEADPLLVFYLLRLDRIGIPEQEDVWVEVMNDEDSVIDRFKTKLEHQIVYDMTRAREQTNYVVRMAIHYKDTDGGVHVFEHKELVRPVSGLVLELERQYEGLLAERALDQEDRTNLQGLLGDIRQIALMEWKQIQFFQVRVVSEYWAVWRQCLELLKRGEHYLDIVAANRLGEGYFYSRLDGSLERYTVCLPKHYSRDRAYPLIFLLPGVRYELDLPGFRDMQFGTRMDEEAIYATVSSRGVTLGSYIGEASFLEAFDVIKQRFAIDENRIYLTGYSNGAYASWALAQAHPSRFAAIAVLAGEPHPEQLPNLGNMPVLNICGDRDYLVEEGYRHPESVLGGGLYEGILETNSNHLDIFPYHYLDAVFRWMLQWRRNPYPSKIVYRTERGRHNQTYWLQITKMNEGSPYAQVSGEMTGESTFVLDAVHVDEFKLTLPDRLESADVEVTLQNQSFFLDATNKRAFIFANEAGRYRLKEETTASCKGSNHGMGVLGIYMDSLQIVIPSQFASPQEEESVRTAAAVLARPKTNAWDPNIVVQYPIVSADTLSDEEAGASNLICIATRLHDHEVLRRHQNKLQIACEETGYGMYGSFTKGDYCILFIQPNPANPNKYMLVVAANRPEMFNRNIITRKMVIPGYFSGLHQYLNREIIVYDGALKAMNFHDVRASSQIASEQ